MSDEQEQEAARAAAAGGPEAEAEQAKLSCRKGVHEWSEWATVGRWLIDIDGNRVGEDYDGDHWTERVMQRRVCWWCFGSDHRRNRLELPEPNHETTPPPSDERTQVELTPAGRRMQETRRNSHLRARWGPCPHEGCVRFENHGGDCATDVPMPLPPPQQQYEPTRYVNTRGLFGESDPRRCAASPHGSEQQCRHAPWQGTEWCYNHQPNYGEGFQPDRTVVPADLLVRIPVEELRVMLDGLGQYERTPEQEAAERLVRWCTVNRPDLLDLLATAELIDDPTDPRHVVVQF